MEPRIESIWKPCSKEEYENACAKYPYSWFFDYLRKPIYDGPTPQGLLAQIVPETRKIIGYNYFKKAGEKLVLLCNSMEELKALEKAGITEDYIRKESLK